tara:strand:- start:326 stop:1354 length:1029 start_codon:yes stop_codon:yes gene_type:complete
MKILNLNYKQYSDLFNLKNNLFFPLKNFVNKDELKSILFKKRFRNFFFPFPITFGLNKSKYLKFKHDKKLILVYKSQKIAIINKIEYFHFDKEIFGKKIFGKNFKKHSYFKQFFNENYIFLNFKIKKFYKNTKFKNFVSPYQYKRKIKSFKTIAAFHTRNVPHNAHQWIHSYLIDKFDTLLIHPLVGQYKKGEYKDNLIIKTNQLVAKNMKKKVFCFPFYSYPRYGGPREAFLHAIVRKNYGCTHMWIGRDHAGYSNFFKLYESQKFCKKYQNEIKINIVSKNEPYYCKKRKKITNNCKFNNCNISISGSKIRSLINKNKKIPEILMSKKISSLINKNSLIS